MNAELPPLPATPAGLVDALLAVGGKITGEGKDRRLRGKFSPELDAALRANSAAVCLEWDRREADARRRYRRAPDTETALHEKTRLPDSARRLLEEYVCRQMNATLAGGDHALHDWLAARATIYREHGQDETESLLRASLDLACWQTRREPADLWYLLETLEEVAKHK